MKFRLWLEQKPAPATPVSRVFPIRQAFSTETENNQANPATITITQGAMTTRFVTLTIPAGQTASPPVDLEPEWPPIPGYPGSNSTVITSVSSLTPTLLPIEFEVKHTEIDPATGQAVNPGANTMLRDEIVDIRIKVPPIGNADWTVDLSVEPEAMRTQSLPNRGNVQMYDFGQIEDNGTVTPDKTQFVLEASAGGERTIRAVFNKNLSQINWRPLNLRMS